MTSDGSEIYTASIIETSYLYRFSKILGIYLLFFIAIYVYEPDKALVQEGVIRDFLPLVIGSSILLIARWRMVKKVFQSKESLTIQAVHGTVLEIPLHQIISVNIQKQSLAMSPLVLIEYGEMKDQSKKVSIPCDCPEDFIQAINQARQSSNAPRLHASTVQENSSITDAQAKFGLKLIASLCIIFILIVILLFLPDLMAHDWHQ